MEENKRFKKKYVLGEGYPWAMGTGPYKEIAIHKTPFGISPIELDWPKELWGKSLPRYRLELVRVPRVSKTR